MKQNSLSRALNTIISQKTGHNVKLRKDRRIHIGRHFESEVRQSVRKVFDIFKFNMMIGFL